MRLRYTSSFKGIKGVTHQIKIWDTKLPAGGTPINISLTASNYEIDFNSEIKDVVTGGIISSSATVFIKNINGAIDALLSSLQITENRYLLEILKDSERFWCGVILPDFGTIYDFPDGIIELGAVDGIGLLRKVDVTVLDSNNISSFLQYVITGLNNIATSELYDIDDNFLRIKTDWYNDTMVAGQEPLDITAVNDIYSDFFWSEFKSREGYNGATVIETEPNDYRYLLQSILEGFNAILLMIDGVWTIYQRDLLSEANITFRGFKKNGEYKADYSPLLTSKEIIASNKMYRIDGQFSNFPGINEIKVVYLANMVNRFGVSNLLPYNFYTGKTYTTYPLLKGVGGKENFLHISFNFLDKFLMMDDTQYNKGFIFTEYEVKVKIGSYYLQSDAYSWSTTPAKFKLYSAPMQTESPNSGFWDSNVNASVCREFKTANLPVDGAVTFSFEYIRAFYVSMPSGTKYTYAPGISFQRFERFSVNPSKHFLLYIWDNEKPIADITYIATNTNTVYTKNLQIEDKLFGSAGVTSRGDILIWDGVEWKASFDIASKQWNKDSGSVKDQYFNELLVNEVLSNQEKALLTYSGTIIERNTSNLFSPFQAIQILYKSETYLLAINKVTYNSKLEQWSGSWFQINRTEIRNVTSSSNDLQTQANQISNQQPSISINPSTLFDDITNYLNLVTGEMTSGNSPVSTKQIQIQDKTTLLPNTTPPTGYTSLTKKGTDLLTETSTGAKKSLLKDVQISNGFLYNQAAVLSALNITSSDTWKVPRISDINNLIDALGGEPTEAGGSLKEKGLLYWNTPNTDATDLVGFLAVGNGFIDSSGFDALKNNAYFWLNTSGDYMYLSYNSAALEVDTGFNVNSGMAVRLFRDLTVPELTAGHPDGYQYDDYVGNDGQHYPVIQIGQQAWITENLVETKFRDGTLITEYTSGFFSADVAARCSYNYDNDNAFEILKLKEVNIDADSFEGLGTRASPTAIKNKADGIEYCVKNGKFAEREIFYAAIVSGTLDKEQWDSLNEQDISVTGLTATSVITVRAVGNRKSMKAYISAVVTATAKTDAVEFECDEAPTEDIDIEIVILKY